MKKYLIALSALAFATTSCYEKLNIAPPNAITNEQVQELLKTADDETIETILGAIANTLKPEMYGSGYNFRYSGNLDGTWSGQFIARLSCGNDIVEGNWQTLGMTITTVKTSLEKPMPTTRVGGTGLSE